MKVLLAVAIAACALSGVSTAEEITLVEAKGARGMVMPESIRFGAQGHYASADMVVTHLSDATRQPLSMIAICRRDDGRSGGIGLVSYHNEKMPNKDAGTADGSKAFDFTARALCGRVGLRAWTAAQL